MHIAIEGCSHGELDIIYRTIERLEQIHKLKLDLLLCCGDFQSVRNEGDLKCMAVPLKYMQMQDFHQYYSGEKKAPVLTIFIGGNHEASNYLQELPYGGWVAPNIYYLGYGSVINVGGLRIGGLSGIYKGADYSKGHYEKPAYTSSSIRSVYHVRNLEVFRLKQLSNHIDIFMSHDWPRGIYHHGNKKNLINVKPHFRGEIESNTLGSRAAEDLINKLRPDYWFSGHLHVKFAAILKHEGQVENKPKLTRFLALDKCLPRREFLQILTIPTTDCNKKPLEISHDPEWLTILRLTNHLLSTSNKTVYMPGPGSEERYSFVPTESEIKETLRRMGGSWAIPQSNFVQTAKVFDTHQRMPDMSFVVLPKPLLNPQTTNLCSKLQIDDPVELLLNVDNSSTLSKSSSLCDDSSNISFNDTYTSDFSINPDEINTSDMYEDADDSGISKFSRDELSGDIIMEIPQSPCTPLTKDAMSGISPIRGSEFSTPKRQTQFSPCSSSPRYPTPTDNQHRHLSLSKPSYANEMTVSPLTLGEKKQSDSHDLGKIEKPVDACDFPSISFLPLSDVTKVDSPITNKMEESSDSLKEVDCPILLLKKKECKLPIIDIDPTLNKDNVLVSLREGGSASDEETKLPENERSPPVKRDCSFTDNVSSEGQLGSLNNSASKKLKRRNASFYSNNGDNDS